MLTKFYDIYGKNSPIKKRFADELDFNLTYADTTAKYLKDKFVCWSFSDFEPKERVMYIYIGKGTKFKRDTIGPRIEFHLDAVMTYFLDILKSKGLVV